MATKNPPAYSIYIFYFVMSKGDIYNQRKNKIYTYIYIHIYILNRARTFCVCVSPMSHQANLQIFV